MQRVVTDEYEREMLMRLLKGQQVPFTASISEGKNRSVAQNSLQRKWMTEAEQQLGTDSAEQFRGYCKLHFGVPILRNANDAFKAEYDEVIRPLPYEQKLRLMMIPFDFGVTRLMNTKQKTQYLDEVYQHFTSLGVLLTQPDEKHGQAA